MVVAPHHTVSVWGRFPPNTGAPPGGAADTSDARGVVAEPTGDRQRNEKEIGAWRAIDVLS